MVGKRPQTAYHNSTGPSDGPASNLLDGDNASIWHTNYGGGTGTQAYPYNVVITFGKDVTFQSFSYTPRQEGEDTNGNIKGYELYASTASEKLDYASEEWGQPIAKGDFTYNGVSPIYVNLKEACTAKQIKLVATSAKMVRLLQVEQSSISMRTKRRKIQDALLRQAI